MAAEGGEVLLQRLLITDIGQHLGAPGQLRCAAARQEQTGACHQGRQAHAFQGHRFAAGVGARDRHHPQALVHPHTHRHHRVGALAALLPKQQGVAQPLQPQRCQRIGDQLRPHRPQPGAVAGPGQSRIQLAEHLLEMLQRRLLFAHQRAQLLEHGALGFALFSLELPKPVAQGNHRLGLNEHGAAGGGAVVHQTGQLSGQARLHRQHRPAIALGDHVVLQQGRVAAQQIIQAIAAILARGGDLTAQLGQRRAGSIRHTAAVFDAEAQALLELGQGAQSLHHRCGDGAQLRIIDLAAQAPGRSQGGGHIQQLISPGHATFGAELHGALQVCHPLKAEAAFGEPIEGQQFTGLGQPLLAGLEAGSQGQRPADAAASRGAGKARHVLTQPAPLE